MLNDANTVGVYKGQGYFVITLYYTAIQKLLI